MNRVPLRRHLLFWLLVCAACGWDLYTKDTVFTKLGFPRGESLWAKDWFNQGITYRHFTTFNHGALWGVGQGKSYIFAGLSVIAIGVIVYWLFVKRHAISLWLTTSLALIMGGTLGNLYDRLGLHGCQNEAGETLHAVRDFLLFTFWGYHWPVFNYADVFLVSGAIMLGVYSVFVPEPGKEQQAEQTTAPTEEPAALSATGSKNG